MNKVVSAQSQLLRVLSQHNTRLLEMLRDYRAFLQTLEEENVLYEQYAQRSLPPEQQKSYAQQPDSRHYGMI